MTSLVLICTRIQTKRKVRYIRFQLILHSFVIKKSKDIVISLVLKITSAVATTYLKIRSSSIK
jgi:hypothetical protein